MNILKKNYKFIIVVLIIFLSGLLNMGCQSSARNETSQVENTTVETKAIEATTPETEETMMMKISDIMAQKELAIKTKNDELYMSTVTKEDPYYPNEQRRWFMEMTKEGMANLSLKVTSIEQKDDETLVAIIQQHHFYNDAFDFEYPLLFKLEKDGWKDWGYDFESISNDRYTLKYMTGETRVAAFIEMIDGAYDILNGVFDEVPDSDFQIKLFNDRELLRQRTIPTIGGLFTGWGEPNESLKLFTGQSELESYKGTIQHELVHHITLKMCNNNLSDWFLEGMAVYYGNAYYDKKFSNSLSNLVPERMSMTIAELVSADLYAPKTKEIVWDWYNTGYAYVAYIIETYGEETIVEMLRKAGEQPFNNSFMNKDFKAQNIKSTRVVIIEILGISPEELSGDYISWMAMTDYFDKYIDK